VSLAGRTCLVTGANRGIGLATAHGLAALGARVVLVARDQAAGEAAVAEVRRATGNEAVDLLVADLSSQASIRALAEQVLTRYRRLHVLVNNAGVITRRRTLTVDGIETQFAVNHLAYFLVTNLLLDRIKISAPARIVVVASDAHWTHRLEFDDLQLALRWRPVRAYSQTKLANVLFAYELARRLTGTGVTVNCVHPGGIATKLLASAFPLPALSTPLVYRFAGTPAQGADTPIWLASAPEVEDVTGKYFVKRKMVPSSAATYDLVAARRLWDESARLTGR
jgi:NAD(P)-dependent dehydrogenase (short-subunit alcohol dehydrogenase family)